MIQLSELLEGKIGAITIADKRDLDIITIVLARACNTWHPRPPADLLKILDRLREIQKDHATATVNSTATAVCKDCGHHHTTIHCPR